MQTVVISSRVNPSLADRIKEEARATGVNIGTYLERAVRAHLENTVNLNKAEVSPGKASVIDDLLLANQLLIDQTARIEATLDQMVTLFRNQG